MWNDFVAAVFTTFCESALILRRTTTGVPPLFRTVVASGNSLAWAARLIDTLRARTPFDPLLRSAPFDLLNLSDDSLWRLVLMPQYRSNLNEAALRQLRNPVGMPAPATHTVGVRTRTDDLLAYFAKYWNRSFPLPPDLQFVRQETLVAHRERVRLFLEGFTRCTPAVADVLATEWIDAALQRLSVDDCCDDVFRVLCFEPVATLPLFNTNRPPRGPARPGRSQLEQVLANRFDGLPVNLLSPGGAGATGRVAPPWSRLALYLSYFARLNAILITEVLSRTLGTVISLQQVVQELARLYFDILVTL